LSDIAYLFYKVCMKEKIETPDVRPVRVGLGKLNDLYLIFLIPSVITVAVFLAVNFWDKLSSVRKLLDFYASEAGILAYFAPTSLTFFCSLFLVAWCNRLLPDTNGRLAELLASSKEKLRLSAAYLDGEGVIKSRLTAENHYLKAVEGFVRIAKESTSASLCRSGAEALEDLAKSDGFMAGSSRKFTDMKLVASAYLRSALLGCHLSQLKVAKFFEDGVGFSRNPKEAYAWFNICAAAGNQDAARRRESLALNMPPEYVALAQERSKELLAMVNVRS